MEQENRLKTGLCVFLTTGGYWNRFWCNINPINRLVSIHRVCHMYHSTCMYLCILCHMVTHDRRIDVDSRYSYYLYSFFDYHIVPLLVWLVIYRVQNTVEEEMFVWLFVRSFSCLWWRSFFGKRNGYALPSRHLSWTT